jgi:16S rRNA (uracil1498-N3)-methyltransferase
MRIPRIYMPVTLRTDTRIALTPEAATRVRKVLRLKPGDRLCLFDGRGGEYQAEILAVTKREVIVEVGAWHDRKAESPLQTVLAQGIARSGRMDYMIQKAVELGVTRIIPLSTQRCEVNLQGTRSTERIRHWQGIAISACEQCGRNDPPQVDPIVSLREWLRFGLQGTKLLLHPGAKHGIRQLCRSEDPMTLLIGPEGGLSQEERIRAERRGFIPVSLGPRILRTETAALAALTAIQVVWGDLGR